jgi:mannose-6-phosphate isomerase-like protein (cupin superfamily)
MANTTQASFSPAPDTATSWFFERVRTGALDTAHEGGQAVLAERSARSGFMGPLHRRSEEEVHVVIEGQVTYLVGDETVRSRPGEVVVIPSDVPRTFLVESEQARWLVFTRVSSLVRFEDFGRAVSRPAPAALSAEWHRTEEAAALAAIANANGIEILGPPGTLPAAA